MDQELEANNYSKDFHQEYMSCVSWQVAKNPLEIISWLLFFITPFIKWNKMRAYSFENSFTYIV